MCEGRSLKCTGEKKKVLIIAAVFGFLMKFEAEDVRLLQEMGYEVHYASNSCNPVYQYQKEELAPFKIRFHQIEIQQSPLAVRRNQKALKVLKRIIEEEQITCIHCHTPMGGVLGRLAGKAFENVRVIYTVHGFHFYDGCKPLQYKVFHWIEKVMARYTDAIVTINREDYEAAQKFILKENGKVYQIPGVGLDMEYFALIDDRWRNAARKRLHVEEKFYILSVGELRKNKNQQVILRAMAKLKSQGLDISRICYGIAGEDREKGALRQLAKELGVAPYVEFYGYQRDIRSYLAAADAVAFPSVREGLGMAALEALSMGLPVLAADNRGTREYMKHSVNGLVYQWDDVNGFAEGLCRLCKEQESWRKRRQEIRKSVGGFEQTCTKKVMRRVYNETFG